MKINSEAFLSALLIVNVTVIALALAVQGACQIYITYKLLER